MRTHLFCIVNSRGICHPKVSIEEAGPTGEVEMHVQNRSIIIRSADRPRAGSAKAAAEAHAHGDDKPLLEGRTTAAVTKSLAILQAMFAP